jgi:glycosyltransferase involved in cell wall biosynthesis
MKTGVIAFGPVEKKTGGYEVRCHYLIKSLADLGHKVYVLEFPINTRNHSPVEDKRIQFIRLKGNERSNNKFLKLLSVHMGKHFPIDPVHLIRTQLYSIVELVKVRKVIEHCDTVFVESVFFPFGLLLSKLFGKKIILDTHYVGKLQAVKYKRAPFSLNFLRAFLWDILERFSIKLSDFTIVVSDEEKTFVKEEYGIAETKILVIPVTVELPKTKVSHQKLRETSEKWGLKNKVVIMFLGLLDAPPNMNAAQYIINELALYFWNRRKDVIFLIVGKGHEQIRGSILPNVIFTGFVKDLSPFFELADVCIAPLRMGSGVKTKILEYMSHEKLVLTTPAGIEGIKLDKTGSVIVSDIESYPESLLHIISHLEKLKHKGKTGKKIIKKYYTPSTITNKLSEIM